MTMKLKRFIAVSVLLLSVSSIFACGWVPTHSGYVWIYRIMPLDESAYTCYDLTSTGDSMLHRQVDYKHDNLRLWQQQTSKSIAIEDIEYVVYKIGVERLKNIKDSLNIPAQCDNSFVKWIKKHNRTDIVDFLIMAKQNETIMWNMNDPWYYDVEDNGHYQVLGDIVEQCNQYKTGPLLNRYALQMVRALCLLRKYDDCAKYWERVNRYLAGDVVKKMAELKVASALYKTGNQDKALEIYAKYGDVASIRAVNGGQIDNELEFVYERHPNSPYIEGEIQKWLLYFGDDSTEQSFKNGNGWKGDVDLMNGLLKVAHKAVREKKSKKMAMWYYTLAALYDTKGEPRQAKKYLERGLAYSKDPFLKDSYRVLQMWLDARTSKYDEAYEQRLKNDLEWLVQKIKNEIRPEVYEVIKPQQKGFYIGGKYYYDYSSYGYLDRANSFYWNDVLRRMLLRVVCPGMHKVGKYVREIQLANFAENLLVNANDYSNEMFQIMDRLSYKDTRNYFSRIYQPQDEFDIFLNSKGKTDMFYWYDILATKCMRERRYSKAIVYLRQIPLSFQKQMNVYDCMTKDPFSYDMETFKDDSLLAVNYKLHFAEKMVKYEQIMRHHRNRNERSKAKIQYALGLRNSVYRCWFLTRHSSNGDNSFIKAAVPDIPYPNDSCIYRCDEYLKLSDKLINEAILSFTNKELAAQELRKFLRYQRIMDSYGDTETAADIRAHCDKWKDYAEAKIKLRKALSLN